METIGSAAMTNPEPTAISAIVRHLEAIASLTEPDRSLLAQELHQTSDWKANKEIIAARTLLDSPSFIISGWVGVGVPLPDGRRQLLDLYIPGDLIGYSSRKEAKAKTAWIALTDVVTVKASGLLKRATERPGAYPGIVSAFALLEAQAEQRLIDQIVRIGALSAHERLEDFLNSLQGRLAQAGLASGRLFKMPITQETLGDLLGLSTVHVNRVLQRLRRGDSRIVARRRFRVPPPAPTISE